MQTTYVRLTFLWLVVAAICSGIGCTQQTIGQQTAQPARQLSMQKVASQYLPNAWQLHPKVISGGLPEGEPAFEELKALGIQTIISVDGAQPDVELARRYGMRYVHLPHGYDGVPVERAQSLAKAVKELTGPIYIHCHHGKHRSPTAAAVACIGSGLLEPDLGLQILSTAGTGENYRGLYQAAAQATRFEDALLDALQVEFQETVNLPPIAEAMVQIESCFDKLKKFDKAQWNIDAQSANRDPVHQALLLREHYTELLRSNDLSQQAAGFIELVTECEREARQFEVDLSAWQAVNFQRPVPEAIHNGFARLSASCITCHQRYRDPPLTEKPVGVR